MTPWRNLGTISEVFGRRWKRLGGPQECTRELMLVEAEAQAMQVPSQGDPEETPLRQTAVESCTATTVELRTIGRMSALTYQASSNNSSI